MKTLLKTGTLSLICVVGLFGFNIPLQSEENTNRNAQGSKTGDSISNPIITIIYDNYPYGEGIATDWGFSCVVQGAEKTILFDTGGKSPILLANMEKQGITPKDINLIVFSHIHDDHTGGISGFLEINPKVTIYTPQSFPDTFKEMVRNSGAKLIEIKKPVQICKGVYVSGEIGTAIVEQALLLRTDRGLIVITGCAHPGIVPMVERGRRVVAEDVLCVLGGFHLLNTGADSLKTIIQNLKTLGVRYVAPTHCTGDNQRQFFEKEFGDRYIKIGAGKVLTMNDFGGLKR